MNKVKLGDSAIRAERSVKMTNRYTNCNLQIRGTIMNIDEFFPGNAARFWIRIEDSDTSDDPVKKYHQVFVNCFDRDLYKQFKPLDKVMVIGHLELVTNTYNCNAVADAVIHLQ